MISLHRDDGSATIALDRPGARNAISGDGWDLLADAAASLMDSDVAAVILRSDVPGIFSAGADLAEMAALVEDITGRAQFRLRMARAIDTLAALPMPTIVAVDGGCHGAAVALTLACDICVGGAGARFAVPPAKLGIGYPGGDVARLVDRIGRGHAARLLFTAAPIDVAEAARIGLVHVLVTDAASSATDMAEAIAANAPSAVRLLKRTLAAPDGADLAFDAAFGEEPFATRLAAFRSRRG